MTETNKHGLSRHIPEDVKAQVRKRCGFGCVRCGNPFYQYDHFLPPFSEATSHEAAGIILLCGDCHTRKTNKLLSIETLQESANNPACLRAGFIFEAMDIGRSPLVIGLGSSTFEDCGVLIRCQGENVLSVKKPNTPDGPYLLSARFQDRDGDSTIEIVDNEWRAGIENWDIRRQGQRVIVRRAKGDIALVMRLDPPRGIVVEQMDMLLSNTRMSVKPDQPFRIRLGNEIFIIHDYVAKRFPIGIDIRTRSLDIGSGIGVQPGYAGARPGQTSEFEIGRVEVVRAIASDGPSVYPPESNTPPDLMICYTPQLQAVAGPRGRQLKLSFKLRNQTDARTQINQLRVFAYPEANSVNREMNVSALENNIGLYLNPIGNGSSAFFIDDYDRRDLVVPVTILPAQEDPVADTSYIVLIVILFQNLSSPKISRRVFSYLMRCDEIV